MLTFEFVETEKKLKEIKKEQRDIGVGTETLNRLPIFEPTARPTYGERAFENKHGKITVRGRLGQNHKSLLEVILYKRKFYKAYKDEEGKPHIKILYSEYEVKKHMSIGSVYSKERYKALLDDMKEAYVKIEKEGRVIEGKLIEDVTISHKYSKRTKSNLPNLKGQEIPYSVLVLGDITTQLILEELKFTYDPKLITQLDSGISQAIVRYLKTHAKHPRAGYHLKELVENLLNNVEGQKWYNIKTQLKRDSDKLKSLGIVIDLEKERLFVMQCKANGKLENLF